MMPHGMSAKVCSAFWQRSALFTPVTLRMWYSCSMKVAVATLQWISNVIRYTLLFDKKF
jgi:hypothetical protein